MRGSERTTRQLKLTPRGGLFVCPEAPETWIYTVDLARSLGREDIVITSAHRLESFIKGLYSDVVVDHAAALNWHQIAVVNQIKSRSRNEPKFYGHKLVHGGYHWIENVTPEIPEAGEGEPMMIRLRDPKIVEARRVIEAAADEMERQRQARSHLRFEDFKQGDFEVGITPIDRQKLIEKYEHLFRMAGSRLGVEADLVVDKIKLEMQDIANARTAREVFQRRMEIEHANQQRERLERATEELKRRIAGDALSGRGDGGTPDGTGG